MLPCECLCVSAGGVDSPKIKADGDVRIFVALFPYDPVVMSPNPDAAEEELPFSEGQIIKVCPRNTQCWINHDIMHVFYNPRLKMQTI